MKKFKLLNTLVATCSVTCVLPLTTLSNCSNNVENITCDEKTQALGSKYATYTFNLKDNLTSYDIDEIVISNSDIKIWDYYVRDQKLIVKVTVDDSLSSVSEFQWDITVKLTDGTVYGIVKDLILTQDKIAVQVVKDAVSEFIEIAKVPRPSHFNTKIREYLMKRATELGYEAKTDFDPSTTPTEDDPANVWFDVPASEGYENHKGIYLQGHMDMVSAGQTEIESKTQGIEVEYHEDTHTLTSKNHKTSLGTDNGIGLGTIFSLLQHKEIKHGPIRVVITADEESGMRGAMRLSEDSSTVLNDPDHKYDYLISLDGELDKDGYYRSCQGSCGYKFSHSFDDVDTKTTKLFNVFVNGFKGGHSGNDIHKGRCNATVFILSMLDELNDSNLQIQRYTHEVVDEETQELKDTPPKRTSIPTLGRVYFASDKTKADIETAFNATKEKFKTQFTGEDWDNVKIDISQDTEEKTYTTLTAQDTQKVISLITNNAKAVDEGFWYGVKEYDSEAQRPLLSCNICPLTIQPKANSGKPDLTLEIYCRSTKKDWLTEWEGKFPLIWAKYYDDVPADPDGNDPWEINNDDQIQKMANAGYKSLGIDPYIRDTNGGVEPAWFCKKRPDLQQTCLGTKFEGVHSVNETCYLDPLVNTVKVLIYIFDNLK